MSAKDLSLEEQIAKVDEIIEDNTYALKRAKDPKKIRSLTSIHHFWKSIYSSLKSLDDLTN